MIPNFKNVYPGIHESSPYGDREVSVFSRLMKERIIFLGTAIDDQVANVIVAQLLFLTHDRHSLFRSALNSFSSGHAGHCLTEM